MLVNNAINHPYGLMVYTTHRNGDDLYFMIVLPTLHSYSSEFPCVTLVDHIEHTVLFSRTMSLQCAYYFSSSLCQFIKCERQNIGNLYECCKCYCLV